jgi:hypothetical protein
MTHRRTVPFPLRPDRQGTSPLPKPVKRVARSRLTQRQRQKISKN